MTTWDWYLDTYVDMPVADIVRQRFIIQPYKSYLGPEWDIPTGTELRWTLKEIAVRLPAKNEQAILKSLRRLERRGKIECDQHGWRWKG